MDILEAIYQRRAVRSYQDKPVKKETITKLLNAAAQAPSAMNTQPWAFVVIQERKLLDEIAAKAKEHVLETLGDHPRAAEMRAILERPDYHIFYHAPALIVICAKPVDGLMPLEDCSLAAQNLMLAAHAMGLATCPIGFARMWFNLPASKQSLNIPPAYVPVFPVIVGYQRDPAPPTKRHALEIVCWE